MKNTSIFLPLLTLLFIGLKLTNYIDWSWWWVLLPSYGLVVLFTVLWCLGNIYKFIYKRTKKGKQEIERFNAIKKRLDNKPKSRFQQKMNEMMAEAKARQES